MVHWKTRASILAIIEQARYNRRSGIYKFFKGVKMPAVLLGIAVIVFVVWVILKLLGFALGTAASLFGGWDNLLLVVVVALVVYWLVQRSR